MRVKKQRKHRKIVKFFIACHGFRSPFKVLCDGTFVHHLLVNRITPADKALSNILGAPVKLFTTTCVLAELKSLGRSYTESLNEANQLFRARCGHEKRKSAEACILECTDENNPEHFFVATQDADLRKKFKEIPCVPVVYALRNALLLEPLSVVQRQFVKTVEEKHSHMTELEYKLLKKREKSTLTSEEEKNSSDEKEFGDQNLPVRAVTTTQNLGGTEMKDKVQFKRKKAKGPNPLSCKKKKNYENKNSVQTQANLHTERNDESTMRSRGRKRKRSRRHKQSLGAEG